jgi:hypothetical protein
MDLKRIFRGWTLAILAAVLLLVFVYRYVNSGPQYKQSDTATVISLINSGQVKSAVLNDPTQMIQVIPTKGQPLEASWVGDQGEQLAATLQAQYKAGTLPHRQLDLGPAARLAAVRRPDPAVLRVHEPDAGRRLPGHELRQVQGQADHQGHPEDQFLRRGWRG